MKLMTAVYDDHSCMGIWYQLSYLLLYHPIPVARQLSSLWGMGQVLLEDMTP